MLKKIFLTFFTLILSISSQTFGYDDYAPFLQKGTLIKVQTKIPYTTENLELGSKVYFMVPADVWILEEKAIEKGDIFIGEVDFLKVPTVGINAAMKIKINALIKKNGEKRTFDGRLIFSSSDVLGGNLTNPASYNTTIHPRKVYKNIWGGTLQYVPSGEYEFGQHVRIDMKSSLFVQVNENFYL